MGMDAAELRRVSHAVWEAMASGWDSRHGYFEQTARPVTERMLERLVPRPGERILDLAAGTGVVGFAAATLVGSDGQVVISDFSQAMVDSAWRRTRARGLENVVCRLLDAERLDLPDGSVDGAVCRWGYMLMADPAAAFAETRRVLRNGGRLACAVFAGPTENRWAAMPMEVLREHGHAPPAPAGAPGILALADRDRLRRLFTDNGFEDPEIEDVAFTLPFADADEYWWFLNEAAGAIAVFLEKLDPDQRASVHRDITTRLESFGTAEGGVEFPALSIVASATNPTR